MVTKTIPIRDIVYPNGIYSIKEQIIEQAIKGFDKHIFECLPDATLRQLLWQTQMELARRTPTPKDNT